MLDELQIIPGCLFKIRYLKELTGVIGGHQRHSVEVVKTATQGDEFVFGAEEGLAGYLPHGADNQRPEQLDLFYEVGPAVVKLGRQGYLVGIQGASDDVGLEDILRVYINGGKHFAK